MAAVSSERGAPRRTDRRQYLTFDSGFERGIDTRLWPETAYPWIEDDPEYGQQLVINEERQFYVTRRDLVPNQPYRPWFVNEAGHLVLRCIPTPERYRHLACGVLDRYTIIDLDAKKRRVTVAGNPWQDPYTGERFVGINRYLRNNLNKTGYGFVCIGDNLKRLMYLRIEKETAVDPLVSDGVGTAHTFEIIDDIPNPETIKLGITKMTLLRHLPYLSGSLSTRGAFAQTYGSWHIRMRMPAGRGTLAGALTWPCYSKEHAHKIALADKSIGINLLEQPGHSTVQYHSIYTPSHIEKEVRESLLPDAFVHPNKRDAPVLHHTVDIDPAHPHYIDARTDWIEVMWDWYPDNTCAWFVKRGDEFLETARSPMSARQQAPIPRMIVLKNAFDSWFNHTREQVDSNRHSAIDLATPPPWDFEVDFVRAFQWEGYPPFMGKLPASPEEIQTMVNEFHQNQQPLPMSVAA